MGFSKSGSSPFASATWSTRTTTSPATGELCPVNEKYTRVVTGQIATLQVAGETIRSTHDHPYWVVSGEDLSSRLSRAHGSEPPPGSTTPGRWVDADHLRVGDILLSLDGGQRQVEAISLDATTIDVYNFHVDRLETYAVGVLGWLVHNTYASATLRKDLLGKFHGPHAPGTQAGHIVPTGAFSKRSLEVRTAIQTAQTVFNRYLGSGARNLSVNGFLTQNSRHLGTHTDKFFLRLGSAMETAGSRADVYRALRLIRREINAGAFL